MENVKAPEKIVYEPNPALSDIGKVYATLAPNMMRVLVGRGYLPELAADSIQDAFMDFLEGRTTLNLEKTPKQQQNFAITNARWKANSNIRARIKHGDLSLEQLQEDETKNRPSHEARERSLPDPAEEIAAHVDRTLAIIILEDELNPRDWAVMVLRHAFGFSAAETAEKIHLSVGAVNTRISRREKDARKILENSKLLEVAS